MADTADMVVGIIVDRDSEKYKWFLDSVLRYSNIVIY